MAASGHGREVTGDGGRGDGDGGGGGEDGAWWMVGSVVVVATEAASVVKVAAARRRWRRKGRLWRRRMAEGGGAPIPLAPQTPTVVFGWAPKVSARTATLVNPRSSKNLMGHGKTSLDYYAFVHGYPVHIHLVKPVVHTRLCMAFNFLKQLPKNILLSKSSDISKSSMPKCGHRGSLRSYHVRTYGQSPEFHTLRETKAAVHAAIWDLRKELPTSHLEGRHFEVPVWRLGEKVVCKNAFVVVTGGTPNAHREALTSTIAGTHPTDVNGVKAASQAMKSLQTTRSPTVQRGQLHGGRHI